MIGPGEFIQGRVAALLASAGDPTEKRAALGIGGILLIGPDLGVWEYVFDRDTAQRVDDPVWQRVALRSAACGIDCANCGGLGWVVGTGS